MKPVTRLEQFLATAAGEYDGELPAPITRQEQYLKKIIDQIDGGGSVSPEQIDAAIAAMNTALAGKADKETGKSLMTADEHTKLGSITIGTTQEFIDYIGVKR